MNRREFLRMSAAGALGAVSAGLPIPRLAHAASTSSVVCVKTAKTEFSAEIVSKMVEQAILSFTNKSTLAAAWKEFVSPKDIIGLKINCLGRHMVSTQPAFTDAVIKSLVAAGIDENNIVVWDRFGQHMQEAGYKFNTGTGVKYIASEGGPDPLGYDEKVVYECSEGEPPRNAAKGEGRSCVARILTQKITALINLPVLKNHRAAGVTLALKNIAFGVTNNSRPWHNNNCNPMIPEVCAMPVVKEKYRLSLLDALQACYDGGPYPRDPKMVWKPGLIYCASDMVALDAVAAQVIDAKRIENGLPPTTSMTSHIATAAKMKLGTNVESAIRVKNIAL